MTVEDVVAKRRLPMRQDLQKFVQDCVKEGNSAHAMRVLFQATQLVAPGSLTPSHAYLVELLMSADKYDNAGLLFDEKVVSIEPSQTDVCFADFVKYFSFKGRYHALRNEWEMAYTAFETALLAGGVEESHHGIAAYNCLIIVGALVDRSPPHIENIRCEVARKIAGCLQGGDRDGALAVAVANEAEIKNFYHVCKAAINDVTAHQLLRLTRVYCTLPLAEVATAVSLTPQECRALITKLVAQERLLATIDTTTNTVAFEEVPITDCVAQLEAGISNALKLSETIERLNDNLTSSPSYILTSGQITTDMVDGK